jgi:hypothetical protein
MEDIGKYFESRAAQCRRLAAALTDQHAIEALTEMARELDARAAAARHPLYPAPRIGPATDAIVLSFRPARGIPRHPYADG